MPDEVNNFTSGLEPLPLREMALLLRELGEPEKGLRCVHIAGTNGKGSTAAFLERILREAGYRTGLFTSPHITCFNERMRVNGEEISDLKLNRTLDCVHAAAYRAGLSPNYFQTATAAAFLYFQEEKCEIVVLETGLGGRLDPTNVIEQPEVVIITRIGMDHTDLLGATIEDIAKEKTGIIKPNSDVLCIAQDVIAERIIEDAAKGNRFHKAKPLQNGEYELGLGGEYQLENAALAIEAAKSLCLRGYHITDTAIRGGLSKARWEARFELVCGDPAIVLDGAHNPQAVRALVNSLKSAWPDRRFVFIMGFMRDKAFRECVEIASEHARIMVAVTPPGERALPSSVLAGVMREYCGLVYDEDDIVAGVNTGIRELRDSDTLCACGSLYLAAEMRAAVRKRFFN